MAHHRSLLHELFEGKTDPSSASKRPSAYDVLSYLLDKGKLSQGDLRKAHAEVSSLVFSTKETSLEAPAAPGPRRRHVALKLYYDGAKYSGLAENVGVDDDMSVERALFAALHRAQLVESRECCNYSRCGRTDRGVSAAGQVVALHLKSSFPETATWDEEGQQKVETKDLPNDAFEVRKVWVIPRRSKKKREQDMSCLGDSNLSEEPRQSKDMSEYDYARVLNKLLPDDIRVLGWTPVSDDFSARFSAKTRTYRYFFVQGRMDLNRIRTGLAMLEGNHDFRNFCKMDVEKVYNFERVIYKADLVVLDKEHIRAEDRIGYLLIHGQAFLWHQIRCIASILFLIGRGLEEPAVITELLDVSKNPRKPSYPLADERPLVLHDCVFANLPVSYSVSSLFLLIQHQRKQWEELVLAAARIRNCMESLCGQRVLVKDVNAFYLSRVAEMERKNRRGSSKSKRPLPKKLRALDESKRTNIQWSEAMDYLDSGEVSCFYDLSMHIPLLERSMGLSYEEKVASLKNSSKRNQRYEENVIKKRKTKEEDAAFYTHMTKQGGPVSR